jgi:transitional endoplasmic reticulum ATPase
MDSPRSIHHPQNLQQSRGFGSNFRFPESTGGQTGPTGGNAGFTDDTQEDDLYA